MFCPHSINVLDKKLNKYRSVPCGKCYACLMNRRDEWVFRLKYEYNNFASVGWFVTLTYDDAHVPLNRDSYLPEVSKKDCQLFFKRLRKLVPPFRYYLTSEYGPQTLRPHYHFVIWWLDCSDVHVRILNRFTKCLQMAWDKGFVSCSPVSGRRLSYVTKYCMKFQQTPEGREPCFFLMSKMPAIGSQLLDQQNKVDYIKNKLSAGEYVSLREDSSCVSLPRYYRKKLSAPSPDSLFMRELNFEKQTALRLQYENEKEREFHKLNPNTDYYVYMASLIKKRADEFVRKQLSKKL